MHVRNIERVRAVNARALGCFIKLVLAFSLNNSISVKRWFRLNEKGGLNIIEKKRAVLNSDFSHFRFSLQPFHKKHNGSGGVTGESASGYQGDVSTASNIGGGALKRTGGGGTLLRSSMADEDEASRFSEGSLTSLEKDTVSEIDPRSSSRPKNQQSTSSHNEYSHHRQDTG